MLSYHYVCLDVSLQVFVLNKLPKQTSKVALPRPYIFNHAVGIDVNYLTDSDGVEWMFLNIVCRATKFQIEVLLRQGGGPPASLECLDAFMQHWVSWAGFPEQLLSDRGFNNRGAFV